MAAEILDASRCQVESVMQVRRVLGAAGGLGHG